MQDWIKYEGVINSISQTLTGDQYTRQDICQEMRIALWKAEEGQESSYYIWIAKKKALDFLKRYCKMSRWNPQSKTIPPTRREIPFSQLSTDDFEETKRAL
uniref:Putative sigma-70 region domain containing protein n=1 Tax=viral metagenome TaxID=1070528 RepID=A0A6M3LXF9_9ZZZZ